MNVGMLWFDNDPKAGLDTKIERAASYYREKYGRVPTLCFVHPSMIPKSANNAEPASAVKAGGLDVRPTQSVLPNHFWIGVNGINH
jgi:hypothetical protein